MRELTEAEKKLFCFPMAELLNMRNKTINEEANLTWIINRKKKFNRMIQQQKKQLKERR